MSSESAAFMGLSKSEIAALLIEKADEYNRKSFIEHDPICIPHRFSRKEDIEISGFLTATIAWGQRVTLIRNALRLMEWMDEAPYEFVIGHSAKERQRFAGFVHRTFSGSDCTTFLFMLQRLYARQGGMEAAFQADDLKQGLMKFRSLMLADEPGKTKALQLSSRHLANPDAGSAAKRLNMFLRWMVRKDTRGVDFGLWSGIQPAQLYIPLDVHSAGVARNLGILQRKQNDWLAVEELTAFLRQIDPLDPVKFDYALFGMGVNEKLSKPLTGNR